MFKPRPRRRPIEPLEARRLLSVSLDPAFNGTGRYVENLGNGYDNASAIAVQADGKLIVAGEGDTADVIRLTPQGVRDNSFVYPQSLIDADTAFMSVAIQPDGKIVAGGWQKADHGTYFTYRPIIARFNTNGSLDGNFGAGGVVKLIGDQYGSVDVLKIMPDGKILFAGNYQDSPTEVEFIGRLTTGGTLDSGFGANAGTTTVDFNGVGFDEMTSMVVLNDGKILIGGWGYTEYGERITLARFNADGKKDTTFDGDGLKFIARPAGTYAETIGGMAVRPDGKIVISGMSATDWDKEYMMLGLIDAGGNFQSGFGVSGNGRTILSTTTGGDIVGGGPVILDPAGRIYTTGGVRITPTTTPYDWDAAVARFTPDGKPDTTFDGDGVFRPVFSGTYEGAADLLLASPTRLYVSGRTGENYAADLAVAAFTVDAAVVSPTSGSIAGNLFNDLDADKVKDAGEGNLVDWLVYLDADKDGVKDPGERIATTDTSGNYKFTGLAAGSYRVREVVNAGWRRTTGEFHDFTLASGQNVTGKNFGNTQKVLVQGTLWNDTDGDGVKDAGEAALSGWKVFIDADKDGVLDAGEKTATTNTSGLYSFDLLNAGSYRVRAVQQSGWRRTTSAAWYDLTLASGASATAKNFGFTQRVLISGTVFNDLDGDKVKDSNETGLGNWRVFIDTDGDGVLDTGEKSVLTSSTGAWTFKDLVAGTYKVRVVQQSGWNRTTPTAGYHQVTLGSGGSSTGKLFGEKKIA